MCFSNEMDIWVRTWAQEQKWYEKDVKRHSMEIRKLTFSRQQQQYVWKLAINAQTYTLSIRWNVEI